MFMYCGYDKPDSVETLGILLIFICETNFGLF
jgi:hypothetical protein